jgi:hypothetical protein
VKIYICRRGRPDFVCHAPTIGDGLILFWVATKETPKPSYRVHHGRRRQAKTISAAVAFWKLDDDMKWLLLEILKDESSADVYTAFCNDVITAGALLGK